MFSYFHFSERRKPTVAYLLFYFFMSLGFLTKGLPAILFAGFTMVAWHIYQRDTKKLFTWPHLSGVLLGLTMVVIYFIPFISKGDFQTLLNTLWGQSIERAQATTFSKRILSFFAFPLLLLKDIMPAALLLLVIKFSSLKKIIRQNSFILFCSIVFAVNIWVYWISPESRSRYHYMFHPLLIFILVFGYVHADSYNRSTKILNSILLGLSWLLLIVLAAGIIVVPMVLKTTGIQWVIPVTLPVAVLIFWWGRRVKWSPLFLLVILMLLVRLPYGWITHMERSQNSQASKDRLSGIEMAKIVQGSPVYLLDSTRISTTISYYLQRDLNRIVPYSDNVEAESFYILPDSVLQKNMMVQWQFTYHGNPFSLVKAQ